MQDDSLPPALPPHPLEFPFFPLHGRLQEGSRAELWGDCGAEWGARAGSGGIAERQEGSLVWWKELRLWGQTGLGSNPTPAVIFLTLSSD